MLDSNFEVVDARRGSQASKLDEDGWNSDKEVVLKQLEALNDGVLSVDSDRLAKLRVEKLASQPASSGISGINVVKMTGEKDDNESNTNNEGSDKDDMDEDTPVSLLDYLEVSEDVLDRYFLEDPSDFYENPFSVTVFSSNGDKELFALKVDVGITTCSDFKAEIVRKIEHLTSETGGKCLSVNDFVLSDGYNRIDDEQVFDGNFNHASAILRLRGGGALKPLSSRKVSAKSKAKAVSSEEKMTAYKGNTEKCHGSIKDTTLSGISEFGIVKSKMNAFAKDVETDAETAMKNAIEKMSIEQVEKAYQMLSSETGGTSEFKIGKSTSYFFGMEALEDVSANIDNMSQLGANLLAYAIEKMKADGKKNNFSHVKTMLERSRYHKLGAQSASVESAKAEDMDL